MKSKLAALALAMLFLSGLVLAWGWSSRERVQPADQSFTISEHGTLLEVFDANGKSRFGKLARDGFSVTYEIQGKQVKNVTAFAIGTKQTGLQAGQVKQDGQSASVTVTSSDKALEIISYFILDESAKQMIIGRVFRNVSDKPIILKTVQDTVDPTLVVGGGSPSRKSDDLVRTVLATVKAGFLGPLLECGGGGPPRCPFPPLCDCDPPPLCYPPTVRCQGLNNFIGLNLLGGSRSSLAANAEVVLEMQGSVRLAPFNQTSGADPATRKLTANEAIIVRKSGFNSQ